jgi:hypothetical protein
MISSYIDSQFVDGHTFSRRRMVQEGHIEGGKTPSLRRMVHVEILLVEKHSPCGKWSRLTDC